MIQPSRGAVSTSRGDVHYVHILDDVSDCITLKQAPENLGTASLLADGTEVKMERRGADILLRVLVEHRKEYATVVKLE